MEEKVCVCVICKPIINRKFSKTNLQKYQKYQKYQNKQKIENIHFNKRYNKKNTLRILENERWGSFKKDYENRTDQKGLFRTARRVAKRVGRR